MPIEPRRLNDFAGDWTLSRQIEHKDGNTALFQGHAVWKPDKAGLLYIESGTLQISGQKPITASQRYIWHPDLTVSFDDGRFFHRVPAAGGQAVHWCDPDTYKATYYFQGWPDFHIRWKVSGPRKDYTMLSRYSREE